MMRQEHDMELFDRSASKRRQGFRYIHKNKVSRRERGWRDAEGSVEVDTGWCGILTGQKNNITVLRITHFDEEIIPFLENTFSTYADGHLYYYTYEPSLRSIYHLTKGMSVLNDRECAIHTDGIVNRGCSTDIKPMAPELLQKLQGYYDDYVPPPVSDRFFELLNLLPDSWFDQFPKVVAITNILMTIDLMEADLAKGTLAKLLYERSAIYDQESAERFIYLAERGELLSTTDDLPRQITLTAISKSIREMYITEYNAWVRKWNEQGTAGDSPFRYRQGALTKYSEAKAKYDGRLTAEILKTIDERFELVSKKICRACKNLHLRGCCSRYKDKTISSCNFVENLELV
jgi:hypothetical protein